MATIPLRPHRPKPAPARLALCGAVALVLTVVCRSWAGRDARLAVHAVDRSRAWRAGGSDGGGVTATPAATPPPVIAPLLCNGPSNQIYQAKLAVWTLRHDSTGATLVLPPILPHFTRRHSADKPEPLSSYFEVGGGRGGAPSSERHHFPPLVEELDVWGGTAPDAVTAAAAVTATSGNETCPVFIGDPSRLDRCKKYAAWWAERAAGRACAGGFTYPTYAGDLASLAADLASNVGPAADAAKRGTGGRDATAGIVLACYLEAYLNPAILFAAGDAPGGGYALRNAGAGSLPANDTAVEGDAWIDAAAALKIRGGPSDDAPSAPNTLLALQLRAPDYDVIAVNRSTPPDVYCLAGAQKCDPAKHLRVPRQALLEFIAGAVDGSRPALERARRAALGGDETTTPPAFTHVHVLTNDAALGADVTATLQSRGLTVTSSPDRSLASLMQDYAAAVSAAVFWGTRGSSISANIVHARMAAGLSTRTTVYWEDVRAFFAE